MVKIRGLIHKFDISKSDKKQNYSLPVVISQGNHYA